MVVSLRKIIRGLLFVSLLCVLTFLMYGSCRYIAAWIAPADPYRIPQGHALKVFKPNPGGMDDTTISERLKLFYWYGE